MKIAIYGYGNLGRGIEAASRYHTDVELTAIFTRRAPESIKTLYGTPVYAADGILNHRGEFDVLIICGGSATDLPYMTPALAEHFNVIDSFDTHAKIPEHFENVDTASKKGGNISLISGGWDPGLFSVVRLYSSAVLPKGEDYTFWGRGVSQGHSDAIRRIDGVKDARQYTVPIESAISEVRSGKRPALSTRQKHRRECYVVAEDFANKDEISQKIKNMPNYFADYDTDVHFITEEELKKNHTGLPHGGYVIRSGYTGVDGENNQTIEFSLGLDSNPEFTASVLVALARAIGKMKARGEVGCKTIFDIAPADLSSLSPEELRAHML